jgi:hypothetical protein
VISFLKGRGVNPVRFPGFWSKDSKPGTGTGVPRFLVLGNRNRNRDPVKPGSRLPAGSGCTRFGNRFFKKNLFFELILGIGPKISPFFFFHKLAIFKKICIESNWVLKRERKKESDIYI